MVAAAVAGFLVGIGLAWGFSSVQAKVVEVPDVLGVVDKIGVGHGTLTKVYDKNNGAVCYLYVQGPWSDSGVSVSCIK